VKAECFGLTVSGVKGKPGWLDHQPAHYAQVTAEKWCDWWLSMSEEHSCLAAVRVLAPHATAAAAERSWSAWGRQFPANRASRIVPTGMRAM
jgi:hypothetical protein